MFGGPSEEQISCKLEQQCQKRRTAVLEDVHRIYTGGYRGYRGGSEENLNKNFGGQTRAGSRVPRALVVLYSTRLMGEWPVALDLHSGSR